MLVAKRIITRCVANLATSFFRTYRVTIVGGASEIGQTVSLMLRAQPSITKLNVHDTLTQTPGVILDLSHIPADAALQGFSGEETLERSLKESDLVLATGGVTRVPGTTKQASLDVNTAFIKMFSSKIAKVTPFPFVGILTEPINILVPMAAELMRNHGDYDPKKLFGIATIDHLRAQSLYAVQNNLSPRNCMVPVIGGRSGKTAIPLISQAKPPCQMDDRTIQEFVLKVRKCDENILDAKKGWSATLSVAYGALMFTRSVLDALDGRPAKVAAFVENNDFGTNYFAGILNINNKGITDMQMYSELSKFECHMLERSIEQIRKDVIKGKKILELA